MKKAIFCVLVCMLMIVSTIVPVSATTVSEKTSQPLTMGNTLYVGGSGPNNYTKIQNAIDDASDGDTVFVYYGRYLENLIIEKSITLIGESKYGTIIDGGEQEYDVILIKADGVTVQGFTIQEAYWGGIYTDYYNGIEIWSDHNIIRDNIIKGNQNGIQLGEEIQFEGHENNHSYFNIIEENQITENHQFGVYVIHSAHNEIIKNTISENKYHGVFLFTDTSQSNISQNIITKHSQVGILIDGGFNNTIVGNHIVGNWRGVSLGKSSLNSIERNNIFNNTMNVCVSCEFGLFIRHLVILKDKQWFNQSWNENYWGQPYQNPQPITYRVILYILTRIIQRINQTTSRIISIPIIYYDYAPVQEPYDIEV
jgi:parallel beta-helix repeat protein